LYTDASAYGCRDRLIRTNLGHQAKNGTIGRPGELWFFLGHVIKNRDCSGKSGTNGHIKCVQHICC